MRKPEVTMGKSKNAQAVVPYLQRLLEDEYLQEQIVEAVSGLRSAYGRAARKRAQAAEDKKLYGSLRRAATSVRNAVIALREPEPPPSRRGRNALVLALAIGAAAAITKAAQKQRQRHPHVGVAPAATDATAAGIPQPQAVTTSP
jgi:hypothetical protein